ncbi:MAG: hypothetical protein ABGW85_09615, partial [Sulfurimonas sp.]
MVKSIVLFLFLVSGVVAQDALSLENTQVQEDPLTSKIKNFVSPEVYAQNKGFINIIFEPKSNFYRN